MPLIVGGSLYHLLLVVLLVQLLRAEAGRLRDAGAAAGPRVRAVASWAFASLGGAALASLAMPGGDFVILRLAAQALFGETLVACVVLARLWRSALPRAAAAALALGAGLLAIYAHAYHVEPWRLQSRTHAVAWTGPAPRPLRVLHLSDIQTASIGAHERRAIAAASAAEVDLVLITGDFVQPRLGDEPLRPRVRADLQRLLAGLPARARLGAWAVRGDVDVDWPHVLAGTGIRALTGETAVLDLGGTPLHLVGLTVGMSRGHEREALLRLVGSVPPGDARIVFGHNPNFVAQLAGHARVDLALAGHTHGGQVALPLLGAPITKMRLPNRYASGLNDYAGIPLHVSAGIGLERGAAPQLRFLVPPELCVLELAPAQGVAGGVVAADEGLRPLPKPILNRAVKPPASSSS